MRFLDVRQRDVKADRIAEYRAAWKTLQQAVTTEGGHAWVFNATHDAGVYLEFIEFKQSDALPQAIATAAAALENIAASRDAGTWKEWTTN